MGLITKKFFGALTLLSVATLIAVPAFVAASDRATVTDGDVTLFPASTSTHWSYYGSDGPTNWASLDPAFSVCGTGFEQSPIDIKCADAISLPLPSPNFDYHPTPLKILSNGHTVEVEYESGSTVTAVGRTFELKQFHFHTPSEHTFEGGAHYPLELHAVHQEAGTGTLLVMGIMIKPGAAHPGLPAEWERVLPVAAGLELEFPTIDIDFADFLPTNPAKYVYNGSLTTPPCSEGVIWVVMRNPIEWSKAQISALQGALHDLESAGRNGATNRPTQPLNGRIVLNSPF